jgi:hypothetical protein
LVLPINLKSGVYIAIVQVEWNQKNTLYDITFKWTGYDQFRTIGRERMRDKPNIFKDLVVKKAVSLSDKFKAIDKDGLAEWNRIYFNDSLLWVDLIRNNSGGRIYVQQFFEGSFNVETDGENKKAFGQVNLVLNPGTQSNILYRAIDEDCELVFEEPAFYT